MSHSIALDNFNIIFAREFRERSVPSGNFQACLQLAMSIHGPSLNN